MSIEAPEDEFDRQGNLTSIGKNNFWHEVDRALKKFDDGDIKLLPRKFHNPRKVIRNVSIRHHKCPTARK